MKVVFGVNCSINHYSTNHYSKLYLQCVFKVFIRLPHDPGYTFIYLVIYMYNICVRRENAIYYQSWQRREY